MRCTSGLGLLPNGDDSSLHFLWGLLNLIFCRRAVDARNGWDGIRWDGIRVHAYLIHWTISIHPVGLSLVVVAGVQPLTVAEFRDTIPVHPLLWSGTHLVRGDVYTLRQ
jgi:hypothetical protein